MALDLDKIFPKSAVWPFDERNSIHALTFEVSSQDGPRGRRVALNDPANNKAQVFFDRFTITRAGLEFNRVRLPTTTLDIDPPLTITPGPGHDRVANLLPLEEGGFPSSTRPYDGEIVFKYFGETTGSFIWLLRLISKGREHTSVLDGRFIFTQSGLMAYTGQAYGVFFVYRRTDIDPHPAYHDQLIKDVWFALNRPAEMAKLKARAKTEPDLKALLAFQTTL